MYVIGIDGGGTKTCGLISDLAGNLLFKAYRDCSNYLQVGIPQAKNNLVSLIDELLSSQKATRDALSIACLGLAGAGRESDRNTIMEFLTEAGLEKNKLKIVPDFLIGLASGTFSEPGIIIISGTGSVVFGINKKGEMKRAGGWGHILADEGAGYQFGQEALKAVMRAYDGRGPATLLTDKILKFLSLENPEQLVKWSLNDGLKKDKVASLAPLVFEAYKEGDKVAEEIIDLACAGITYAVKAVVTGLKMELEPFKVVLTGGNFLNQPIYVEKITPKIKSIAPNAQVILPRFEPAVGAVFLALKERNIDLNETIIQNIEKSWQKFKN